jgi:hypothetical protein
MSSSIVFLQESDSTHCEKPMINRSDFTPELHAVNTQSGMTAYKMYNRSFGKKCNYRLGG